VSWKNSILLEIYFCFLKKVHLNIKVGAEAGSYYCPNEQLIAAPCIFLAFIKSAALVCTVHKKIVYFFKEVVSRDFVVCYLVSFDRSEVPTPNRAVRLLFKFIFLCRIFRFSHLSLVS
jgi:hypothetical protein